MNATRPKKPISHPIKTVASITAHSRTVLESRRKNVSRPGVIGGRLSNSRRQRNPQGAGSRLL